jgi:hypothetical protein
MPRWFNTAGPCRPELHYMLPAMRRLPEVRRLIDQEGYFIVHAPRQAGKTTALLSLAQELTAEGLAQLDGYLAGLGLDSGWLVIFDRRSGQPPLAERTRAELASTPSGRPVTVLRA